MQIKKTLKNTGKIFVGFLIWVACLTWIWRAWADFPPLPAWVTSSGGWLGEVFNLNSEKKDTLELNVPKVVLPVDYTPISENNQLATKEYVDSLGVLGGGGGSGNPMPTMISLAGKIEGERMVSFSDAIKYCDDLDEAGYDDWYLPNDEEIYYATTIFKDSGPFKERIWTRKRVYPLSSTRSGAVYVFNPNTKEWSINYYEELKYFNSVHCVRKDTSGGGVANVASGVPTMISPESDLLYNSIQTATYCRDLSVAPEFLYEWGNDTTVYDDWRMPTIEELKMFTGISGIQRYLANVWSDTPVVVTNSNQTKVGHFVTSFDKGEINYNDQNERNKVRCVR